MPGATETEFFERAGLRDTKLGQAKKDDPADVAEIGFRAMMEGDGDVVTGWYKKLTAAVANITPAAMLAEQHRKLAEPGISQQRRATRRQSVNVQNFAGCVVAGPGLEPGTYRLFSVALPTELSRHGGASIGTAV